MFLLEIKFKCIDYYKLQESNRRKTNMVVASRYPWMFGVASARFFVKQYDEKCLVLFDLVFIG